jgi:aarF domain-containing kinase
VCALADTLCCAPLGIPPQAMADAFGRPTSEVFASISPKPVAAASLGQVYRARLRPELGGTEVAIKVQRPGVLEQVGSRGVLGMLRRWQGLRSGA